MVHFKFAMFSPHSLSAFLLYMSTNKYYWTFI